jgi:dimethylaniline monooxygenase (N-oxide forming)
MASNGKIVCVVGAGMLGLLAMKNLKEQGLSVVAFTKDDYIGGLWHTSQDTSKTTALPQTTANTSKQTVFALGR